MPMVMTTEQLTALLDQIGLLAMQLENRIDDLAMYACKRGSPRSVHLIMVEHDRVHRMVRRLNEIAMGVAY